MTTLSDWFGYTQKKRREDLEKEITKNVYPVAENRVNQDRLQRLAALRRNSKT